MKKFIRFILWIFIMASAYAGFEVIQWETILNGRLLLQWSGISWDDIQNLQLRDTDAVWEKPTLKAISGSLVKTRCFDDNDAMYWSVEIPHDFYNGTGSVISPHVHWVWDANWATTWIWNMEYSILKANGTYLTSSIISVSLYNITWWDTRIDDLDGDMSATWLSLWDTISFKIYRTTADTYAGNMCLLQVWRHYQKDVMGSRQEYIK